MDTKEIRLSIRLFLMFAALAVSADAFAPLAGFRKVFLEETDIYLESELQDLDDDPQAATLARIELPSLHVGRFEQLHIFVLYGDTLCAKQVARAPPTVL